ncbi:C-terminal domain of CHU protein family protein [Sphingobacterium wenxiniae]|uniref:C-terminal domain of CHU protein family protein n=2 Tax=Sphingobacterium wenxiniae TaxID=683125 RepID=A0A1I6S148_9SPHI|nr:C-terminal domain of CHU protein family protein [Sphingobacterium wenxiniae]
MITKILFIFIPRNQTYEISSVFSKKLFINFHKYSLYYSKYNDMRPLFIKIKQKYLCVFFIMLNFCVAAQDRLIITEIMANPNNGQLPNTEFIELYNSGEKPVDLSNYKLQVNKQSIELLPRYLASKQFILLVYAPSSSTFERFGNVMPLPRWQALNNSGAEISLIKPDGQLADQVTYSDRWYASSTKRNGGWSLERINPNISCDESLNWSASESLSGGTPGQRNSIWDEYYKPAIQPSIADIQDHSIRLRFPPALTNLPAITTEQIQLHPVGAKPTAIEIDREHLTLIFSTAIPMDTPLELNMVDISWCQLTYQFSIPLLHASPSEYNDIIINEVLFNPKAGGVDFVELYNRSGKIINLQGWLLGNREIIREPHLFYPSAYRVLTTSPETVEKHYPNAQLENFITMSALPPYANERGQVVLSHASVLVDSLAYVSAMHQPFLSDVKGISLERQSLERDTNEPGNFTSASTLVGGATPGYKNSVGVEKNMHNNTITLASRTFSPNGDGFEDQLHFIYAFSEENPMFTLQIFDDRGRSVNRLIRNKSVGQQGEISWDGKDENGHDCTGGIYIFQAEMYTAKGYFQSFKGSFVLVRDSSKY